MMTENVTLEFGIKQYIASIGFQSIHRKKI